MASTHRSYWVPAARLLTRKFLLEGGIILGEGDGTGQTRWMSDQWKRRDRWSNFVSSDGRERVKDRKDRFRQLS